MGVTTVTHEYPVPNLPTANLSSLPKERRHPKAFPQGIKSMDLVEGQWETPGSIMKVTYSDGYEKYKIGACDHVKGSFKHTLIEGGVVGDKVESVDVEMKLVGGSNPVMKVTSSYHTKGGLKLSEEEMNAENNKAKLLYQAVVDLMQSMAA